VVDEPVDHGGGRHVVAEDLTPRAEGLVAGDDHRGAFVAVGDEAEHEVRGFGVERYVSDLVDDQQRDEREAPQLGLELALAFGFAEAGDPLGGGRELDALPGQAGADPERGRDVCFAGAWRVVVALLMLWTLWRSGCDWLAPRGSCGVLSLRCLAGARISGLARPP
jgi:hypothetical protein